MEGAFHNRKIYGDIRGKGCMKKFCKDLKEPTMKITNFAKKKEK